MQYTGVCTTEELFVWERLPFGVRNGPPHFQRTMNQAIAAAGLQEQLGCFIDDLATGGSSHVECAARAAAMFAMLAGRKLLAGADKVFLGLEEICFLGYLLRGGQAHPDPEKVAAIERLLPPTTRSEVRSFLGITGYYRDFIERYSLKARPLSDLLREDVPWEWDSACAAAFQLLKKLLTSSPILALPTPDRPYTIHTDFSHLAISGVLEQRGADNKNHVVCYASRRCSAAEAKLGPTDGELIAIVFAVEKFHPYIAGTKFSIVTDHAALVFLQEGKNKNPKLARMAMRLSCYDFTVHHRAGRVHNNADGLSRSRTAPTPGTPPPDTIAAFPVTPDPHFTGHPPPSPQVPPPDMQVHSHSHTPQDRFEALAAAFEVYEQDPDIHGEAHLHTYEASTTHPPTLGPRQLLLEAAPCGACHQPLSKSAAASLVCDRCNTPFHLRCTSRSTPPPTYWYCPRCSNHIAARGYQCPTEDICF